MAGTEVGTAWVTIIPSAKGFARQLQKDIAREFSGSNLDKMISDAIGSRPIKLPVTVDLDASALNDAALRRRVRLPVDVDETDAVRKVEGAANTAERTAGPVRLRVDIDQSQFRNVIGLVSHLGDRAGAAFGAARSAASDLSGAVRGVMQSVSTMASSFGSLLRVIGLLAAIPTAAGAATGAIYALGGALGSLPAFAAGLGAIAGTLTLGFRGLGDAFKETASGGGGGGAAVRSASALRAAEQGLVRSKRDLADATEDLNRARADEVKRIRDVELNLRQARNSEKRAELDVFAAAQALDRAGRSGRVEDQQEAAVAYEDTVLALEEAKNRTSDLSEESAKASDVGVEGSDQVQAALRRQQDATEAITNAQLALNEAMNPPGGGGAGGVAKQLTKLAPSAERFVQAIKDLAPAFDRLRLNVQEKLFAGLDKSVRQLATAWLPQLNKTLGDYATTFNGFAKNLAASLAKPEFIANIAAGAESVRQLLEKVGKVVSGPLVDAFGRLSRAADPFIDVLGDELAGALQDFSDWVARLDGEGKLDSFFTTASGYLHDLFDMGRDVFSIFGSVVQILFGTEDGKTKDLSPWEGLKDALDRIAAWFKDPENQQKVQDWIAKIQEFVRWVVEEAIPKVAGWIKKISEWVHELRTLGGRVDDFKDRVNGALNAITSPLRTAGAAFASFRSGASGQLDALANTVRGLPGRITSALGNLGGLLWNAGWSLMQGLMRGIRDAIPGLQGLLNWVTGQIPNWKGPYDRDRVLLEPAGRAIMGGLIGGIHGEMNALRSELGTVTGVIAGTALTAPARGGYGLPAAATPTPGRLVAEWVGAAADPLVGALRDNIRIYHDGDPNVAFGTGGKR